MEVTGCDNCGATIFDTDSSSTFDWETPLNKYTITFGYDDVTTISLYGADAYDTFCLNDMSNSCTTAVPFVGVLSQTNLDTSIDGIAGLQSGTDGLVTNLIMKYFKDASLIDEQTFSIYLDSSTSSYIDFGTPNTLIIDGQSTVYLNLEENDGKWTNYVKGLYWDTDSDSKLYTFGQQKAYLSTGSSCISGPYNEVGWMVAKLTALLGTCTASSSYG